MPAPQALIDSLNKLFDDKDAAATAVGAATQADSDAKAAADKATQAHGTANAAATTVKTSESQFITDLQNAIDGAPAQANPPVGGGAAAAK